MSIVKLALNIPISHIKGDHKDLEGMRNLAKLINQKVNEMEADDKKALMKEK